MVIRFSLFVFLFCLSLNVFAKGLTAQVDHSSVGLGEHVQLVLTLSDVRGNAPDLSALEKDFTILQRSQSSNMKVLNGVVSQETRWIFLLEPNRKGVLTIPSLMSGPYQSAAISVEVGDAPVDQSTSDDVFLEVEIKPINPYVKGQAIYTQRLYFAQQLVNNASLDKPKLEEGDAEILFLGEANPRNVERNGRQYRLIERYYSVFPDDASGLLFSPSIFRGSISDGRPQRGFNMPMFNTGKRVTAYSSKVSLAVADQPTEFTGRQWLPSGQLNLDMSWSQSPDTLVAGEPVTVTVMVMAEGLKAETLPKVSFDWPASIKNYPEKPEFRTDKRASGVVGRRQEKIVLVANQQGEFQIPAVEITWWDTVTNQQKVSRIDSFVVKVDGSTVVASEQSDSNEVELPVNKVVEPVDDLTTEGAVPEKLTLYHSFLVFYSEYKRQVYIIVVFGMLLGFVVWVLFHRIKAKAQGAMKHQALLLVRKRLSEACGANDARAVTLLLPQWASVVGISPATLSGIERAGGARLSEEIKMLSRAQYSSKAQVWSGGRLMVAIDQFSVNEKSDIATASLGELHPKF